MKRESGKAQSPAKRIRDREELEEQARLFGQDWHAGDRIQTWLNRHEGKLGETELDGRGRLVLGDVGRAMHIAGITYRTGEPIAPDLLRRKAYRARVELSFEDRQAAGESHPGPRLLGALACPAAAGLQAAAAFRLSVTRRAGLSGLG